MFKQGNASFQFQIVIHVCFFITRLVFYKNLHVLKGGRKDLHHNCKYPATGIMFCSHFKLLQFYFAAESLIKNKIYGYYCTVAMMFHNILFLCAMLSFDDKKETDLNRVFEVAIPVLHVVEIVISVIFVRKSKREYNLEVFQEIGASPNIKKAFSTRQKLQYMGNINFFLLAIEGTSILHREPLAYRIDHILSLIMLILSIMQQITVFVNIYDENRAQRKVALSITAMKLVLSLGLIFIVILELLSTGNKKKITHAFIYADIILLSVIFFYYMSVDMLQFGSGLKECYKMRTRKIYIV